MRPRRDSLHWLLLGAALACISPLASGEEARKAQESSVPEEELFAQFATGDAKGARDGFDRLVAWHLAESDRLLSTGAAGTPRASAGELARAAVILRVWEAAEASALLDKRESKPSPRIDEVVAAIEVRAEAVYGEGRDLPPALMRLREGSAALLRGTVSESRREQLARASGSPDLHTFDSTHSDLATVFRITPPPPAGPTSGVFVLDTPCDPEIREAAEGFYRMVLDDPGKLRGSFVEGYWPAKPLAFIGERWRGVSVEDFGRVTAKPLPGGEVEAQLDHVGLKFPDGTYQSMPAWLILRRDADAWRISYLGSVERREAVRRGEVRDAD